MKSIFSTHVKTSPKCKTYHFFTAIYKNNKKKEKKMFFLGDIAQNSDGHKSVIFYPNLKIQISTV